MSGDLDEQIAALAALAAELQDRDAFPRLMARLATMRRLQVRQLAARAREARP